MPNRKPWWIWALVAVGVFVLASPLLIFLIWLRIETVAKARMWAYDQPCLWNTPSAIPDLSISPVQGQSISFSGVTFDLPWNDLSNQRDLKKVGMLVLGFDSGQSIALYVGGPAPAFLDMPDAAPRAGTDPQMKAFQQERSIAQSTPSRVRLWGSPQSEFEWVLVKSFRMDNCNRPEVFSVSTPGFKGFQYGMIQPGNWNTSAEIRLYSPSHTVVFHLQGAYPRPPVATQADINLIVQSLREAPLQRVY
jgi:hypothetical protein